MRTWVGIGAAAAAVVLAVGGVAVVAQEAGGIDEQADRPVHHRRSVSEDGRGTAGDG